MVGKATQVSVQRPHRTIFFRPDFSTAATKFLYQTGDNSLLVSQFSYKRFDADTIANSTAPYELLVETTEGGDFNGSAGTHIEPNGAKRGSLLPAISQALTTLKSGSTMLSSYDGRIDLLPVTIAGVLNLPIENITFGPVSTFAIHQNETAWFLADKWAPFQRLTIELGVRFDRDSVTSSTHVAPRAGFALLLTKDAKKLIKGGAGLFYDRVPLNVVSFPLLPARTISYLSTEDQILESTSYINTIAGGRLHNPRSVAWNVEVDRQVTSGLTLRAGFQQRSTTHDFLLTPESGPSNGILSLSNAGGSFYREFQLAGQYKIRRDTLNASYVRSKAYGDLNDFNQFFGNNAAAVIEPNQRGLLPFDAPNRFLFWGQFEAPFKLTVLPVLDVHTGFPWSVVDEYRDFVGARDSQRFRRFNSFDMQVTRPVSLPFPRKDIKARVGFSVFNLFNRFNPRDVQNDIDILRYEAFFNGVGRTFCGKFVLEF
jgi:TonB dependent receptor